VIEDELDLVRSADVEIVGDRCFEEGPARRGASKTMVLETSIWRMESSHQYPATRSSWRSGVGITRSQRSKKDWICWGPR
jgi:hypothetical protein